MHKGRFITFEGGEGAGKSTQVKMLAEALIKNGQKVLITREPGGSEGGEIIREILVNGDVGKWDSITEALLFYAARRDHVVKKIMPALNDGLWVISDRFADSTMAYQASGYKDGISKQELFNLHKIAIGDFKPDMTFILDLPVEKGLERALARSNDKSRFEKMDISFHQKLRQAFLDIAKEENDRCVVIPAEDEITSINNKIWGSINDKFKVIF
ncbi:MAG: dTMP kinase [Alphaproteobacteria bacterium]